jgi:hypothetical protein
MGDQAIIDFATRLASEEDFWSVVRFAFRVGIVAFIGLIAARFVWQFINTIYLWLSIRLFNYVKRYDVVELYGHEYKLSNVRFTGCIFEGTEPGKIKVIPLKTWAGTEKILITQSPRNGRKK